jgi:O-antigen/teichoic acid export membrane protein
MSNSLRLSALGVVVNRWGSKAINLVTFVILARALTTSEFGIYGLFTSAIFIVEAAGNLGLRQASAHQIGQKSMTDGETLGASLLVWPLAAIGCGLAVTLSLYGSISSAELPAWLWPALLACSGVVLASLCQGVFLGRGQIRNFNFVELTPRVLLLVGTTALLMTGNLDVWEAGWIFGLSFAITGLLAVYRARPDEGPISPSLGKLWRLIRYGWPFALTLFLIMLNTRVSLFVLTAKLDTAAAGQYFAGLRLNELVLDIAAAVGLVLFSHGARSADPNRAMRQAAEITRWLTCGAVVIALGGIVLSPILVPLLLGEGYAGSVGVLQLLLVALPFAALSKVIYPTLAGVGRPLIGAVVLGPSIVLNAALSWVMTDLWGVPGAGLALGITQLVVAVAFLAIVRRSYAIPVRDFVLPRAAELAAIGTRLKSRGRRASISDETIE